MYANITGMAGGSSVLVAGRWGVALVFCRGDGLFPGRKGILMVTKTSVSLRCGSALSLVAVRSRGWNTKRIGSTRLAETSAQASRLSHDTIGSQSKRTVRGHGSHQQAT